MKKNNTPFITFTICLLALALSSLSTHSLSAPPAWAADQSDDERGPPNNTPPKGRPSFPGFLALPPPAAEKNPNAIIRVDNVPIATSETYTVLEDNRLVIDAPGLLANDSDPDGEVITAQIISGPATLNINSDGSLTYEPPVNFNGTVEFSYSVCDEADPFEQCADVVSTIDVIPVEDDAIPQNDVFTVFQDGTKNFNVNDLTENDINVDSEPLFIPTSQFESFTTSNGGTIEQRAGELPGNLIYSAPPGFSGKDIIIYNVCRLKPGGETGQTCWESQLIFDVIPIANPNGWIPIPNFPSCQSYSPTIPPADNGLILADESTTSENWTARNYLLGIDYDISDPVPGGVYIGDLGFSCTYSAPYSAEIWNELINHFTQQVIAVEEYIASIDIIDQPSPQPFLWLAENNPGIQTSWVLRLSRFDVPVSALLMQNKFAITIVAVNDPSYPPLPDSLRNAIRITITDGGKQVLRDSMIDMGYLSPDDQFDFDGSPFTTE